MLPFGTVGVPTAPRPILVVPRLIPLVRKRSLSSVCDLKSLALSVISALCVVTGFIATASPAGLAISRRLALRAANSLTSELRPVASLVKLKIKRRLW